MFMRSGPGFPASDPDAPPPWSACSPQHQAPAIRRQGTCRNNIIVVKNPLDRI
jgi:hypothetical protein